MAAPKLRFYESDDSAEIGSLSFTPTAGTPTAAQQVNLWNDKGDVEDSETATEVRITAFARNQGDTNWLADHEALTSGWLEIQAIDQSGTGIAIQTTSYRRIGYGRYLHLLDIPKDCKRELEVRLNVPASAGTDAVEIKFRAVCSKMAIPLSEGFMQAGAQGVFSGLGDGLFSGLIQGGAVTETGTPDNNANVANLVWIHKGVPYVKLAHAIPLNNADSEAATLASGESYWAAITAGASTTLTVTKGLKGTSPLPVSDRPDLPDGELLIAYVEREFDATIEQADIYESDRIYYRFGAATSGASLNVTIWPGVALVGDELIDRSRPETIALAASDDSYVWLNPDGTITDELTGVPPQDRSLLLWIFTTDGSGVTASVDRRTWIGRRLHVLQLEKQGTLSVSQKAYAIYPSTSRGQIRPVGGIVFGVSVNGTTSGGTKADFSKCELGATSFTTLFTSSGTNDQRPVIAENSTSLVTGAALPEVLDVGPMAMLQMEIVAIPGGSDSANAVGCILIEEV